MLDLTLSNFLVFSVSILISNDVFTEIEFLWRVEFIHTDWLSPLIFFTSGTILRNFSGISKWVLILRAIAEWFKSGTLTFQKKLCYLLDWKLFKNDEKCFIFSLKALSILKISSRIMQKMRKEDLLQTSFLLFKEA